MDLYFDLPSPMVRDGESWEYEPTDYYNALDEQVNEYLMECLRKQFYKRNDRNFRVHLLTYMRRHNLPIYQDCYDDVLIF
jgi:hypothetical protein